MQAQAANQKMLVFKYKAVKGDSNLREIALEVVKGKGAKDIMVDRLWIETFRSLRKDGIVHLMNVNTDEYLLITRAHVLEPFVRAQLQRKDISKSKNFQV
ncbi:MAG: hypothetical protein SGARI_002971 [Bacillariaceae sp.]